mmetsp:Transcript_6537/g.24282  ORF Transcript_6537/g.24282 Transcript_6537/m.24282 type:complete len:237 (-) Transcript_6537:1171-1881(-)
MPVTSYVWFCRPTKCGSEITDPIGEGLGGGEAVGGGGDTSQISVLSGQQSANNVQRSSQKQPPADAPPQKPTQVAGAAGGGEGCGQNSVASGQQSLNTKHKASQKQPSGDWPPQKSWQPTRPGVGGGNAAISGGGGDCWTCPGGGSMAPGGDGGDTPTRQTSSGVQSEKPPTGCAFTSAITKSKVHKSPVGSGVGSLSVLTKRVSRPTKRAGITASPETSTPTTLPAPPATSMFRT